MKKYLFGGILLLLLTSCENVEVKNKVTQAEIPSSPVKFYSKEIKDTIYVSISAPEDKTKKYPVVYLLDANLHYDIMAATFKHYSEVNMLPEAILVGIGYKNIFDLDSLRNRDLTFPKALPEYEMALSGGAHEFQKFIQTDLFNYVESNYPVDKTKRVLMGHSLSGYFALFAMHQNLLRKNNAFSAYIAASPALHYNKYYLLKEFDKLKSETQLFPKAFVSYGGLEYDQEDRGMGLLEREQVLQQLNQLLWEKYKIPYKGEIYSNIAHMDAALPGFVKGVQWTFDMVED